MARTIPAVASIVLPDTRLVTSTKPVDAGSATNSGHWYDIAKVHNLNAATVNAQPVHIQNWDGNFVFGAHALTFRYEVPIPKLTDQHVLLTCRVYGKTNTAGTVTFVAVTAALNVVVTLPLVAAWTAAAATLNVSTSFGVNDYETIQISTTGDVDIEAIHIEYSDINPGGAYPGADDALAAGVGPDGVVPLDLLEVAADSPLCSEIAQTVAAGISTTALRFRSYFSGGSIDVAGFQAQGGTKIPVWRTIVPISVGFQTMYFRLQAAKGGAIRRHIIQHGASSIRESIALRDEIDTTVGFDEGGFTAVDIAAGAGNVYVDGSFTIRAGTYLNAPGAYLGFAMLALLPADGLLSFAIWGE